jgi:predicted ribosome quality control (RQC) complex YloA/Tae2 family protein
MAKFTSFNEAFRHGIEMLKERQKEEDWARKIRTELKKLEAIKLELEVELSESGKAEEFRHKGEAILANLSQISPGADRVVVPNPYAFNDNLEIVLDPHHGPKENAQQYFARYKKMKRKIPFLVGRMAGIVKEIEKLHIGAVEGPPAQPPKALPAKQVPPAKPMPSGKKKKEEAPAHFRKFLTRGGFEVLTGKDSRTNEELTFKFARPFDIFFHARGLGGAHVILRTAKKKPSKYDIYDAAAIAAYFSRAKNARRVPVQYAERKFIKRHRGGIPGAVFLMREEVIFADPGLPGGAKTEESAEDFPEEV